MMELNRIASHLVWLATTGMELGALSMMIYGFREREYILDIFELDLRPADEHGLHPARAASRRTCPTRPSRRSASSSTWMPERIDVVRGPAVRQHDLAASARRASPSWT